MERAYTSFVSSSDRFETKNAHITYSAPEDFQIKGIEKRISFFKNYGSNETNSN
jgi:hypothetical protein